MSARRTSLRARLAAAGLDVDRTSIELERASLLIDDGADVAYGLLPLLSEAADPQKAVSCISAMATDCPDLLAEVVSDRDWLGRVIAVAGASQPLGALLAQHADAVEALRTLDHVSIEPTARAVYEAVGASEDSQEQSAGIAAIRRAATADIAARDLTGQSTVEEVADELAALAQGVLTGALDAVHRQVAGADPAARIAVIGMGKLGGLELNYVSDVDVVFVHEPTDASDEGAASREANKVLTRLLELLNASTTMGRAYEVDPTLRPEGRTGALSRTVDSFVAYWERWAKTWEFQALIKARPVAGDTQLGERWLRAAEPYVWPENLDPAVIAEIRGMKSRIESKPEVRRHGDRQVKLGPGGIRDIEFTVQLLQLVHGRGDRSLRSTGTLPALAALAANGYVDDEDAQLFASAYRQLRMIEHRLQLAHERRTHTIPTDEREQELLARSLGYRPDGDATARAAFFRDLGNIQGEVRDLHAKLFYRPLMEAYAEVPTTTTGVSVPGEVVAMGNDAARERLEALGFVDGEAALGNLRSLTSGLSRRARTVRAVLPAILDVLQDTPDPDRGLTSFRELVEAQGDRGELLAHLRDHPPASELLGRVLGTSRVAGELLAGQPQGIDWLRDEQLREHARTRDELVRMAMARLHWQDTEAALRRFKRLELLRIVLRDLSGASDISGIGAELAALGEACLVGALRSELRAQAGKLNLSGPDELPVSIAIIGMGKLGGRELHYASDLDVVFVHELTGDSADESATKLVLQIVGNVMKSLSAITAEGSAFEVDADLRPEGKSGPLSRTLASYEAYWERWSEPWEHQALIRARYVAGDRELGEKFIAARSQWAYPTEDLQGRVTSMRRMKARMEKERIPRRIPPERHLKLGPGGLSDVEWTIQLLLHTEGGRHKSLRSASTMESIDALEDEAILDNQDAVWLRDGYRFLSELRNRLYLLRYRDVDVLPQYQQETEKLARAMGYGRSHWQELEEDRRRHARHVRQVCERVFYGIDTSQEEVSW